MEAVCVVVVWQLYNEVSAVGKKGNERSEEWRMSEFVEFGSVLFATSFVIIRDSGGWF